MDDDMGMRRTQYMHDDDRSSPQSEPRGHFIGIDCILLLIYVDLRRHDQCRTMGLRPGGAALTCSNKRHSHLSIRTLAMVGVQWAYLDNRHANGGLQELLHSHDITSKSFHGQSWHAVV
jgi:hypothetical protein